MSEAKKFEAPKLGALEKDEPVRAEKTADTSSLVNRHEYADDNSAGRRRVPRRAVNNRVGILFKGTYFIGFVHEIGEGGLSISGPINMVEGDRVVLTVKIPEALEGVITVTVVYAVGQGQERRYGVRFDDIDFDHKRKIRNFVASGRT